MNEDFVLRKKKELADLLSNYINLSGEDIFKIIMDKELSNVFRSPELLISSERDADILSDFIKINKSINLINAVEVSRERITEPMHLAEIFRTRYLDVFDQEHINVMLLNSKAEILEIKEVTKGTINISSVNAREIFKDALLNGAVNIAICHNHPSGNPTPSIDDIEFTKSLEKAGDFLNINVLDHIVVGRNSFTSIKKGIKEFFVKDIEELIAEKLENESRLNLIENIVDIRYLNFYRRVKEFEYNNNFSSEDKKNHQDYLKNDFITKFKAFVNEIENNSDGLTNDFKYQLADLKILKQGIDGRTYEDLKFIEKFYLFSVKEFYETKNQNRFNYNKMPNYFKKRIENEYIKLITGEYNNNSISEKLKNISNESVKEDVVDYSLIKNNKHNYALIKMVAFLDVTGRKDLVDEVVNQKSIASAWRVMKDNIPEEELVNDFINMDDSKFLERRNELKKSLSSLKTGLEEICSKHQSKDYIKEKEVESINNYEVEEDLEMEM